MYKMVNHQSADFKIVAEFQILKDLINFNSHRYERLTRMKYPSYFSVEI